MKKTIDILLAFNEASCRAADQFAQMLLEAFERGNVTDAQLEDVSSLLERHRQWCVENEQRIYEMEYGR